MRTLSQQELITVTGAHAATMPALPADKAAKLAAIKAAIMAKLAAMHKGHMMPMPGHGCTKAPTPVVDPAPTEDAAA